MKSSPACVELFRRALAGDQDAWTGVQSVFNEIVLAMSQAQDLVDPEDLAQEAWLQFYRYTGESSNFVLSEDLGAVLNYLKRCTETALLQMRRKAKVTSVELLEHEADGTDLAKEVVLRIAVQERLIELLPTVQEQLACLLRYGHNWPARQIYEEHKTEFDTIDEVYQVIQRITRRLRKDEVLQDLGLQNFAGDAEKRPDDALLKISMLDDNTSVHERDKIVTESCPYDEAILLDYVTGLASAELCLQIEESSACTQAAADLAREIRPLVPFIVRALCPETDDLLDYYEKTLTGAKQLVVRQHVRFCPLCQEELQALAQMKSGFLSATSSASQSQFEQVISIVNGQLIREIVEAIFQPPMRLPQPVRGDMYLYETPQVTIHLGMRRATGKARSWTLRGELRTPEGERYLAAYVIHLLPLTERESLTAREAVPEDGTFIFKQLRLGRYSLHVLTDTQEIIVREIQVGTDSTI